MIEVWRVAPKVGEIALLNENCQYEILVGPGDLMTSPHHLGSEPQGYDMNVCRFPDFPQLKVGICGPRPTKFLTRENISHV